ncbi:hypothetical protein J6TS7_61250 [Paenibacillus dendritiformis]|nr:hypothetical protein J6TS7_61250 [Paenibacillus dendritiformis]
MPGHKKAAAHAAASSRQVKDTERIATAGFLLHHIVKTDIEEVAQSRHVEQMLTQFMLHDIFAIFA